MATIPRQQINRARALFRRDFHKEATPEAGRVVRVLLDAIVEDPDPRWVPSQLPTHVLVERVVAELPMIFEDIAEQERTNVVRAPNVLHWLGVRIPDRLKMLGFVFDKE
jgi:hypothetical protein